MKNHTRAALRKKRRKTRPSIMQYLLITTTWEGCEIAQAYNRYDAAVRASQKLMNKHPVVLVIKKRKTTLIKVVANIL